MKKQKHVPVEDLIEIPEEMVQLAANQFKLHEDNNFKKFLESSALLKTAGLHPVFLCTEDLKYITITTEEKILKRLH